MENKTKNKVVNGSAALLLAAFALAVPFIVKHEGESLTTYQDVAGVFTVCSGEAGVKPGTTYTAEECDALTQTRAWQYMQGVHTLVQVPLPASALAAHTSFAYNIGLAAYQRSITLKETNAGHLAEGCKAMYNWHEAGGKDCRIERNNCYGLIRRRADEVKLCLSDLP